MRFKGFDLLLVLLCGALLFSGGLGLFLLPHASFSNTENRALTTFPALSLSSLADGRFAARFHNFCADQFPLRSLLIAGNAYGELLLGKQENNGILLGKNGYLIPRGEYTDLSAANENIRAIRSFCDRVSLPAATLIVPRHIDLLRDQLPHSYSAVRSSALTELLKREPTLMFPLEDWYGKESFFYKTDHHWTVKGAYEAYRLLGNTLGYIPKDPSFFEIEQVSDTFLGTSHSKIGGIAADPDKILLYRYEGDMDFLIENEETGEVFPSFYEFSALDQKDQYEIFLGGNHAHITVTLPAKEDRPHLLIIKDSYANSLIPFLSLHFDLTVWDLRYLKTLPSDLEAFDRILILEGADTLATDPSLKKLAHLSS